MTDSANDSKIFSRKKFFNKNSLKSLKRSRKWSDAEKQCQKEPGGHLMSFHSEEEVRAVQSIITHDGWTYWIGLRMNCPTCSFTWSDHSAFDFSNWQEGEPNNVGGVENCVEMKGFDDFGWNDHKCSEERSFFCAYYLEGDPLPTPPPPSSGGCPPGPDWILYGGVCYKFKLPTGLTGLVQYY